MGYSLTRDTGEQWEIGCNAIDGTIEAMRDNLRDRGVEDGDAMESLLMGERSKMQDELSRNIEGDFSDPYEMPDFDDMASDLLQSDDINTDSALEVPAELSESEINDICADIEGT